LEFDFPYLEVRGRYSNLTGTNSNESAAANRRRSQQPVTGLDDGQ
jgi:hypothetical protein